MTLQNQFLVAMPDLDDPFFQRSVVYICEDNEQGSMGLVINQPTDLSLAEMMAKMNHLMPTEPKYPEKMIFAGGPVNIEQGFVLHTVTDKNYRYSFAINDDLMLTTSSDILLSLNSDAAPKEYFIALGCALWQPEQLAEEIKNNDWLTVPADYDILFKLPFDQRWQAANKLLGINQSYELSHEMGRA
ncbi:hypothetical protein JP28_07595 [Gallibacterium anatis]|uniref:UPF0301 protein UMN179_00681 n=3 Tax=Gallibacterium anatis TaxID=750 RepID=F4HDQ5_GALAU|nr:YqgE/AlgH family protein [Gallibacterium anatis]AEC16713.1 putative transcriptional regulator [Gallibacterium anatis UMN179]ERF79247.1 hypothetical protein N561_02200 [Gallibacterium anatis 12656/12]KGQ26571.1 hypothetical protein JP33_02300 [Gallibacterium anatis CCM5995]KGQ34583.1 hypothetical protein JP32_00370 [Gallibacterium anatis]KGQ40523.1 hypothetical protein JP30_07620 [Gallibacterium anatis IPDH697-78]